MKFKKLINISVVGIIMICVLTGGRVKAEEKSEQEGNLPSIKFESTVHDFNEVSPLSSNSCTFKFRNTGGETLKITDIKTTCGCTVARLDKKEYEPNEFGEIKASFQVPCQAGVTSKVIYVMTNDPNNRNIQLALRATVKKQIEIIPESLNLSLKEPNGACPDIILKSVDDTPFSIEKILSPLSCITFDINSLEKKTSYVLKPKVDIEKLSESLEGNISIYVGHSKCRVLFINYKAPEEYKLTPSTILVFKAEPGKKMVKDDFSLTNQYGDEFNIVEVKSENGYIKLLDKKLDDENRYKLKLEINPPVQDEGSLMFKDNLIIKTDDGHQIRAVCRGFFERT